jgi:hypothetical protein
LTRPDGSTLLRCDHCDPKALIDQANQLFESHVRLRLPTPDKQATPKGAYAGLQKSDADYYNDLTTNNEDSRAVPALEVIYVNDTVEKSRLHLQLAAIQAASIYGVSLLSGDEDTSILPGLDLPATDTLATALGLTLTPSAPFFSAPLTSALPAAASLSPRLILAGLARGAAALARSPKDAVLVWMLLALFAGAVTAVRRRQMLLNRL